MKCRLWCPVKLEKAEHSTSTFLFGWFISCSGKSVDVVVAFCRDESWRIRLQPPLQEWFSHANARMPTSLQSESVFSLIGKYNPNLRSSNGEVFTKSEDPDIRHSSCPESGDCGEIRNWISLIYGSYEDCSGRVFWIPKLECIRWNGRVHVACDLHVIFYETPLYGDQHYCMLCNHSTREMDSSKKKPKWMAELNGQESHFAVETVLRAINCSASVENIFHEDQTCARKRPSSLGWKLVAFGLASISTAAYIILQCLHRFLTTFGVPSRWLAFRIFVMSSRVIRYYCCQIQYWPLLLQDIYNRSTSCVEYAEKEALRRHSMWSTLAVDLILGNLIGLPLLFYAESSWLLVSNFMSDITNHLLRSGCVWLMGVPAGFKLNTELAGTLGMLSLNVVQAWFTIWVFMGGFFIYLMKACAILGIIFGATMLASLAIDLIKLSSIHVLALHWVLSTLYSHQTRAISSLWRLFRGRKMNPLRQRLDSYDYSVKQHIVGSLLFTPLLLLLPTTSVFYIYFTILKTAITIFCVLNEIAISFIYCTPYVQIIMWVVKKSRFPSGIWLQIVSRKTEGLRCDPLSKANLALQSSSVGNHDGFERSSTLVSILQSNFSNLGDLIYPHYRRTFSGISSFVALSFYGALTGQRTSSLFGCRFPTILPWMSLPPNDYWRLCYNSVLTCRDQCS